MKNKSILSLALSTFFLILSGCGGESATILEDPNKGVTTTSNGCAVNNQNSCRSFTIAYPVEGLNFECSSLSGKFFATELIGNTATGSCVFGDKVRFYIQGQKDAPKIDLGTVDLKQISTLDVNAQPVQISLLDIAKGMTGKNATSMMLDDETFKTLVGITRIFQAVGVSQNSNIAGDVQPINLTVDLKNGLKVLSADVTVKDFKDGTYSADLAEWLDFNSVSEPIAKTVAEQQVQLKNVSIFKADSFLIEALRTNIKGFSGQSSPFDNKSIANLYALTSREGYTTGYAVQWTGKPINTGAPVPNDLNLLISQVSPQKLNIVDGIKNWINPLSNSISNSLILKTTPTATDQLDIFQGTVFNQKTIPGNEFLYNKLGNTTPPNENFYGKWRQTLNNENFDGSIDIYQTNPATYLNRAVFKTLNTVSSGEKYIFPLYATLEFSFADTSVPKQSVGIVIEESGDIRTNLTASGTASDRCLNVNKATMIDTDGVQQFRVGTTGAANDSANDKSVTIRIILANPVFGNLDGAIIGLNDRLLEIPQQGNNVSTLFSGGVRLNLQNLIVSNSTASGINISDFGSTNSIAAQWVNMQSVFQNIYNTANPANLTTSQLELAKRQNGTIDVFLPSCYQIKTKS
ncbi:MAG: hypothetical protein H9855_10785 [Candidatus Acinetobacter avistercoris]|uniref:putative pilus system protein FilF n=1 Tax=Acinetobacter sp. KS-LM10 TaxID=3120518 RepID=UPI001F95259F|nr:hypothetical protein [Candidatus Acinetobacter avistercoris]